MHRGSLLLKLAMAQELWPENDHDWLRDELQAIPDWHVGNMRLRIMPDFSEFRDDDWSPGARERLETIAGCYRYRPHELCLRSKCFSPGLVSHEMGHHVWGAICWQGWYLQFWDAVFGAYSKFCQDHHSLPYVWYDWKEFFADGYMVLAAVGQDYANTDWEPRLINSRKMPNWLRSYEQEYPDLAEFIRSLFVEDHDDPACLSHHLHSQL